MTTPSARDVTLTIRRADAQELFDNLDAWSDDWERTEGERIPLYDRACAALHAAMSRAAGSQADGGETRG